MNDAIVVDELTKHFGTVEAVSDLSFRVARGELFGFLGPNGAGKTTTINMLTGLARPDAGSIHIGGIDCSAAPRAAQGLIGVVPDESNLYAELTGFENLCFCAALHGLDKSERQFRAHQLLDAFGLSDAADRKFGGYSKGMKRKLTIAAGIIHNPEILFLDEPTTGIDVASARQLRQLIADLHQAGTTIFLTTHYIEEAERLCDRIAFIVGGRIVRIDTVEELLQPVKEQHVLQIACAHPLPDLREELAAAFTEFSFTFPGRELVRVEGDAALRVGPLLRFLEEHGAEVAEAKRMRPSLEDVFVRITGIETGVMGKEKERGGNGR
ncbi:ABC transporter ATP-binding protein [Desulfuromonas sp. CSMB_57]|uniref:ABC transporter ATP-binding protein n=1 Tax=Desulfuromonas sp. CSMB_57 TaxID=2807629 RepID=UPI001CD6CDBD|nr:ABC transporter ATP-binding protein [Desulfuromonas sp. CSMB_57]